MIIQPVLVLISILVAATGILAALDISLGSYEKKEKSIYDKTKTESSGQASGCGTKATCCKRVNVSGNQTGTCTSLKSSGRSILS